MKNSILLRFLFRQPAYLPAVVWSVIILILMGIPGSAVPELPQFMDLFKPDKLIHLFLFAVLAIAVFYGNQRYSYTTGKIAFISGVLYCLVYAGITEWLQYAVFINRKASFWDFLADAAGVAAGIFIYRYRIEKKIKKFIFNSKTL